MSKEVLYKKIPSTPGVYLMKNKAGAIVYVGKAGNIKRRVASYFNRPHDARIEALVREIDSIGFEVTDSALEALILESRLIKEHAPKYNIREKDGKSFLYVEIMREEFPRPILVRGALPARGIRFGPFVSAGSIREGLRIIRRIFPWCDQHSPKGYGLASQQPSSKDSKLKPCFNYQIGLCPGACIGVITKEKYKKNIENIKLFFRGEKKRIIKTLEKEMRSASKALEFEHAARIRGQIFALQHIHDTAFIEETEITKPDETRAHRIEGYDISNISGTSAVGGMVVFVNENPKKSEYRLFNIKTIFTQNDTGMLSEVIHRRFKNNWPLPDLLLIDGGVGQINAARAALKELGMAIPVIGIAKGADRKENRFLGIIPPFTTRETLIKVRDESHRFSRKHHIRTRAQNFYK